MNTLNVVVIGCGNSLAGDDAVGVEIIGHLQDMIGEHCPDNLGVELVDAGIGGLDVIDHILDVDRAVIADAVLAGEKVGSIAVFSSDVIPDRDDMAFSVHGINLVDAITMARRLYPERVAAITVVGVEVGQPPAGMPSGMSLPVRRAIPVACDAILDLLDRWSRELSPDNA